MNCEHNNHKKIQKSKKANTAENREDTPHKSNTILRCRVWYVPIHRLDERVNEFQHSQFVFVILFLTVIGFGPHDEKETGVTTVNDFVAPVLQKGALQLGATETLANDFAFQGDALFHGQPLVIRTEPGLALFVTAVLI